MSRSDDKTLEALNRTIAESPRNARSYELRSAIWLARGESQRAIDDCNAVVNICRSAVAYNNRGMALMQLNRLDEAWSDLDEAVRQNPEGLFLANRGCIERRLKNWAEAIDDLSHALRSGMKDSWVHVELAQAYRSQGNEPLALDQLHCAIRQDLKNAGAYVLRGLIYHKQREYPAALKNFDRALALAVKPEWLLHRCQSHLALGRHRPALADVNESIRLSRSAAALLIRSHVWTESAEFVQALADAEEAVQLQPDLAAAYSHRGLARLRTGDSTAALADLEHALELERDHAVWLNNRGYVRRARGEHALAIADFQKAIELAPRHPNAYKNLASLRATCVRRKFRDGTQAVSLARQALELAGEQQRSWFAVLASAYAEAGDFDAARRALATSCERVPIKPAPLMPEELPVQFSIHTIFSAITITAGTMAVVRWLKSVQLPIEVPGLDSLFILAALFFLARSVVWKRLRHGTPRERAFSIGICCAGLLGFCDGLWSSINSFREASGAVPGVDFARLEMVWYVLTMTPITVLTYAGVASVMGPILDTALSILPEAWRGRLRM